MFFIKSRKDGFTLIELLVVISIIGMLSSIVLASLNTARAKSRDSKRMSDLRQMQLALEQYYDDNRVYPTTGGNWHGGASGCYGGYGYGSSGFIPSIVPKYMPQLPADPKSSGSSCYLYRSDGSNYMVLVHHTIETFDPDGPSGAGPFHPLDRPCCNENSIAVYSPGARNW